MIETLKVLDVIYEFSSICLNYHIVSQQKRRIHKFQILKMTLFMYTFQWSKDGFLFILDCCFSELIVHTLVPWFWLAIWSSLDILIGHMTFFENYLICVSMGAFFAILVYSLQVSGSFFKPSFNIKLLLGHGKMQTSPIQMPQLSEKN